MVEEVELDFFSALQGRKGGEKTVRKEEANTYASKRNDRLVVDELELLDD